MDKSLQRDGDAEGQTKYFKNRQGWCFGLFCRLNKQTNANLIFGQHIKNYPDFFQKVFFFFLNKDFSVFILKNISIHQFKVLSRLWQNNK